MFYAGYWFNTSLKSAILYMFISVFTVSGNAFVILVFILDPYKQLRTLQNYYIFSLSCSDMLMGLAAEPLLIATYWHYENTAENSLFLAHYLFAIISGVSSLMNMAALSVFRCIAIKMPFTHYKVITRRRVIISIMLLWMFSVQFSAVPLLGWRGRYYQLYLYGVGCVAPSIVICCAYFGIFRAIKQHSSSLQRAGTIKHHALKAVVTREKATAKTLLIILGVFLAFWGPFLLVDFLMVQFPSLREDGTIHLARDITLTFTYFSSGINPVLYAWRVNQFRRAFIRLCCCGRHQRVMRRFMDTSFIPPANSNYNSGGTMDTPSTRSKAIRRRDNGITTRL
ncbi:predicted protein [Nematostella vectensis]|uniref:G-protein coupled receptors family 1 profile domain-containing protein n=1 Tax=Nematostella vectensis TaxID=45351 RepID=A7SSY9_NEMVE|nr:histamine H2 receptor [Nematostella vectensis]XP_032228563.1 histamine H2 receptor [Nematostella vectensis]XP_032228564.1 histamine H2 receptor [Nematostella vectensis]EDO33174.1 predicted protein [Nematostella vectensis]|eukprot:XP_001625274.1 predicted protein [Nematostella vectensis]